MAEDHRERAGGLRIGDQLGNYRVTGLLGQGGMSAVYRAKDSILSREVALKVLPADLALNRPQRFEQFIQEAKSAARLDHPNVVTIYHIDQHTGTWYVAMELVDGKSLKEVIEQEGQYVSVEACTAIIMTVAQALLLAHERGILHRDIKPSNVMLTRTGVVKITDFGLAAEWDVEVRKGQTQRAVGTPLYMAPELCYGHPPTPSTDMYALGMTYYVLLTGDKPFAGGDVMETFRKQVSSPIPDVRQRRPDCPAAVQTVISKLLAKNPRDRYEWMDRLVEDLAAVQRDPKTVQLPSDVPLPEPYFDPNESGSVMGIETITVARANVKHDDRAITVPPPQPIRPPIVVASAVPAVNPELEALARNSVDAVARRNSRDSLPQVGRATPSAKVLRPAGVKQSGSTVTPVPEERPVPVPQPRNTALYVVGFMLLAMLIVGATLVVLSM